MLLSPRYDGPPVFAIEGSIDDQREPMIRQRRRLQDALANLTDDQWSSPSRCEGWTAQDVVAHLIGTNSFWSMSIVAGLAASPTRALVAFDPVEKPALMLALSSDPTRRGSLAIDATEPDVHFVVEVGTTVEVRGGPAPSSATRLSGRAVDLVDILSIRAPLDQAVPEDSRWLLDGLATVFDTTVEHV